MDLCRDPIKIIHLSGDLKQTQVNLFLGLCPPDIISEVQKVSKNKGSSDSPILKNFYGPAWRQKLGFDQVTGGSAYSLKGFLNAEDDIIDISSIGMPGDLELPKQTQPQNLPRQQMHNVITDIGIFPEDRIMDLKLKIFATTGIAIYNQHVFIKNNDQVVPMRYKITADGIVPVDIIKAMQSDARLFGFPIDHNIYHSKDSLRIVSFDYSETIGNIFKKLGVNTFYVINLDELLSPAIGKLREQFKQDKIQLELFYYSFIVKYWPMISISVFEMIMQEKKIKSEYPDLEPSHKHLHERLVKETRLLNRKYELLADAKTGFKKYPKFKKLSPKIDKPDPDSVVDISIASAVLEVSSGTLNTATLVGKTQLDIQQLYRNLSTSTAVPIIKTNLIINNKPIIMTKYDKSVSDIQQVYQDIKYRMQLPYFNSILFAVRIPKRALEFLVVVIRNNGKYMIRSTWEKSINFKTIFGIIQDAVNPHILAINNLGRTIFTSTSRLRLIAHGNSQFSDLHMTMLWKNAVSEQGFKKFGEFLRDDFEADIIRSNTGMLDADDLQPNMIDFTLFKGMTDIDTDQLEKHITVDNYYQYLTDSKVKQKWNQIVAGKPITITRRTTDVKFELSNLREVEFRYFYSYFIVRMFDAIELIKHKGPVSKASRKSQNRLKYLKERDPVLFKFQKFGSDIVYSRICQKAYQPEMYTEGEFKELPNSVKQSAVKYWNFTTKTPAYYVCPNPKFPSLSFIHDKHPKKFCLPCCKKSPTYEFKITRKKSSTPGKTEISKKETIYKSCLLNHMYTGDSLEASNNRYIMKYGKPLDTGRISYVPNLLDKYLKYNLSDKTIYLGRGGYITNDYGFGLKTYSIEELWNISKNNKVRVVAINTLREHLEAPKWSYKSEGEPDYSALDIIKNPNLSSVHSNRITNADLKYPILIYRNIQEGWQQVVDGLHRLAKAFTEEKDSITVKYITKRQLSKAEIKHSTRSNQKPSKIDSLKKPGFYLYGVPQNSESLNDIGCVFSIAAGMNLSIKELAQKCITEIKKKKEIMYFRTIFGGKLIKYFKSMDDVLTNIREIFINSKPVGMSGFKQWNDLFIDIVKYCFNIHVIIFDDQSVDVSGTSMKYTDYVKDIRVILPEKITTAEDLIPESTADSPITQEYMLVFRKRKRSKSIFSHNFLYYPLFVFTPYEFFKTLEIDKKVFTQDDEIMKLIKNILRDTIKQSVNTFEITLSVVYKFLESIGGSITKIYVTSSNLCYAIDLIFNKTQLTIPVKYSSKSSFWKTDIKIQRDPLVSCKLKQSYKDLVLFMKSYNNYIVEESKKLGMINIGEKSAEASVTPVFPFMKADKIIKYKNKIIGVGAHGLYYYFNPMPATDLKQMIKSMSSPYSIFAKFPVDIVNFNHSPDFINNHIWDYFKNSGKTTDKRYEIIPEAYYDRYLYQMLVMGILQYLDSEKNTSVRNRIKKIINITKFRNMESLETFRKELKSELKKFPQDIDLIKELVNEYYIEHFDKNILLNQFDSGVYQFDRISLNEIEEVSKDFGISDDPKINKNVKTRLKQIADQIVVIKSKSDIKKLLKPGINKTPGFICNSNTLGCLKEKLIISAQDLDNLLDILVADFLNPLKRSYLLSSIYTPRLLNEFKFKQKPNEQIFIKTF